MGLVHMMVYYTTMKNSLSEKHYTQSHSVYYCLCEYPEQTTPQNKVYQWLSEPAGMVVSANGNKLFFCADQNVLELDSRDG